MAPDRDRVAMLGCCGRADQLGRVGGRHDRAGHQHAAGREKSGSADGTTRWIVPESADHGLGRSRAG